MKNTGGKAELLREAAGENEMQIAKRQSYAYEHGDVALARIEVTSASVK